MFRSTWRLVAVLAFAVLLSGLGGCGDVQERPTRYVYWGETVVHESLAISVGEPLHIEGGNQRGLERWEGSYHLIVGTQAVAFSDGDFNAIDDKGNIYPAEGVAPRPDPAVPTTSSETGLLPPGMRQSSIGRPVWYLPPQARIVRVEYLPRWSDWRAVWGG